MFIYKGKGYAANQNTWPYCSSKHSSLLLMIPSLTYNAQCCNVNGKIYSVNLPTYHDIAENFRQAYPVLTISTKKIDNPMIANLSHCHA